MPPSIKALNSSAAMLSASQLRKRYTMALAVIAMLTIAAQGVMQFVLADQKYDSRVVNMAGRQRMLSQKITALSYYISTAQSGSEDTRYRRQLAEALNLWERTHAGLLRGDSELGLPGRNSEAVENLFGPLHAHHEAIAAAARAILSAPESVATLARNIDTIRQHEADFLAGMSAIVTLYDREANAKVVFARWLEIALMSTTLLVLVLSAAFICAPATRRIQRDMTELAAREEDLERLFSASPTAFLLVLGEKLTILHANQKAMNLLGLPPDPTPGVYLAPLLAGGDEANQRFLDKLGQGETLNECEVRLVDAVGEVFEALVSVNAISFSGQAVMVLGITSISELKRAQQTLEHYATFDELTGLLNRRTGMMMLDKSMARMHRQGGRLAVCFVDLDGLKATNDDFGHAEGDWLISTVARVLIESIRASDAAVRLGGDEFLLLLHDCDLDEGSRLLDRAEQCLQETAAAAGKPFPIAFSYGLVLYTPENGTTADELISAADSRMYQAKLDKKRLRGAS
ncbi:MAG: putative diguanylate cyclase YeaJ [Candidatus Accumulibacter regalis]|jgi:diguanylate cyclase (GGDEF)-like protein/PAS domain S-box-containing protein|uniref:Diguanylate cyclase YeaJ n=2 Tax=Candidatus Accumulibacter TaxID=327159 RepID=A0A011RJF5_ACCRE|nr:MAG: putative diguanylate cyclase YeaJ [Candidatus Accumulibacter regalis]